jgi:hypothetical protein
VKDGVCGGKGFCSGFFFLPVLFPSSPPRFIKQKAMNEVDAGRDRATPALVGVPRRGGKGESGPRKGVG